MNKNIVVFRLWCDTSWAFNQIFSITMRILTDNRIKDVYIFNFGSNLIFLTFCLDLGATFTYISKICWHFVWFLPALVSWNWWTSITKIKSRNAFDLNKKTKWSNSKIGETLLNSKENKRKKFRYRLFSLIEDTSRRIRAQICSCISKYLFYYFNFDE